jgi:hypothetical protein
MNQATAETKKLTDSQRFAKELDWHPRNVWGRLKALDLLAPCTRCGGCGRFSYCQMYGDLCFGCSGRGVVMPKYSKKLISAVRARVADGGLAAYLAKCERIKAARAVLPSVLAEAKVAYHRIADAYSAASDAADASGNRSEAIHALVQSPIFNAQHRANMLFWEQENYSGAQWVCMPSVHEIETSATHGEMDAETAVAMIRDRITRLEGLTW